MKKILFKGAGSAVPTHLTKMALISKNLKNFWNFKLKIK